jgi:hypothetical protein
MKKAMKQKKKMRRVIWTGKTSPSSAHLTDLSERGELLPARDETAGPRDTVTLACHPRLLDHRLQQQQS